MKQLTVIILTLATLTSFSQTPETTSKKKLLVGLTFSPDYCYRTLHSNASSQWIADIRNDTEIPKFGFTAGLAMTYKLKKRFLIETGLQFSDKGEKTKATELAKISGEIIGKGKYKYHYYYLDIPLKINYLIIEKPLIFFISGGFSANIFLSQKTILLLEYVDGSTETVAFPFFGQG